MFGDEKSQRYAIIEVKKFIESGPGVENERLTEKVVSQPTPLAKPATQ